MEGPALVIVQLLSALVAAPLPLRAGIAPALRLTLIAPLPGFLRLHVDRQAGVTPGGCRGRGWKPDGNGDRQDQSFHRSCVLGQKRLSA